MASDKAEELAAVVLGNDPKGLTIAEADDRWRGFAGGLVFAAGVVVIDSGIPGNWFVGLVCIALGCLMLVGRR